MSDSSNEPKIYLLPNLMTAGNLCCGFFAVLTIFKGMGETDFSAAFPFYEKAILTGWPAGPDGGPGIPLWSGI